MPKVIDATKQPITERDGVPDSNEIIIQIIVSFGTLYRRPISGTNIINGKQVVIQ